MYAECWMQIEILKQQPDQKDSLPANFWCGGNGLMGYLDSCFHQGKESNVCQHVPGIGNRQDTLLDSGVACFEGSKFLFLWMVSGEKFFVSTPRCHLYDYIQQKGDSLCLGSKACTALLLMRQSQGKNIERALE